MLCCSPPSLAGCSDKAKLAVAASPFASAAIAGQNVTMYRPLSESPDNGESDSCGEETATITVTNATKIVSAVFSDGKRNETSIVLASLKAGDIIMATLKEGTQEAESIRLNAE